MSIQPLKIKAYTHGGIKGQAGWSSLLGRSCYAHCSFRNEVELFNELFYEKQRTYGINHFDLWWTDIPHVNRAFIKEWELAENDFLNIDEGYWDRI